MCIRDRFEYNAETKEYSRFQFNAPHIDQNTGNQLTCENIILQYSNYVPYDPNGYLNVDTQSGGEGKYITRGKAIDIHWTKDSQWGITHYYDSNNQEIQLNPGYSPGSGFLPEDGRNQCKHCAVLHGQCCDSKHFQV